MSELGEVFRDMPADSFPMKVEFMNQAGEVVHTIDIPSPGVVHVPALAGEHGPVTVAITYPKGFVTAEPDA